MLVNISDRDLQVLGENVRARLLKYDLGDVPSAGAIAQALEQLIRQRVELLTTDPDEWTHEWSDRHLLTQVALAKEPQPVQLPSFV